MTVRVAINGGAPSMFSPEAVKKLAIRGGKMDDVLSVSSAFVS
jgi:hypothetical protein